MRIRRDIFVIVAAILFQTSAVLAQGSSQLDVLLGTHFGTGFDVGVDSSGQQRTWLSQEAGTFKMAYPSGQDWGAVFMTVGKPGDAPHPSMDFSAYQALVVELQGDPGTTVNVGIKDASQPNDGSEFKVPVTVSADWQTFEIPLTTFVGADLKRIYTVAEFVFAGSNAQTVRVRRVSYTTNATKILPQLAFGGGWYSALYFTNTSSSLLSMQVNFVREDGTPLTIPNIGGSSKSLDVVPHGTAFIEAPNSGTLTRGYVVVALPSSVVGYGVFRQSLVGLADQEAVVPLSGISATTSTMIWDETEFVTGVAIVNPSAQNVTVSVVVRDKSGQTIGTSLIQLPAKGKTTAVLKNLPGLVGMAGKQGSADFSTSGNGVAVLGLRFRGTAFTSIPTADR